MLGRRILARHRSKGGETLAALASARAAKAATAEDLSPPLREQLIGVVLRDVASPRGEKSSLDTLVRETLLWKYSG